MFSSFQWRGAAVYSSDAKAAAGGARSADGDGESFPEAGRCNTETEYAADDNEQGAGEGEE